MSARMLRLYFLIVLATPAQGVKFWTPLAIMYLPSWVLALLATAFPNKYEASLPEVTTATIDGVPGCTVQLNQLWFLYALYGIVLFQLCFVWVLTILVSRVRMGFNEFKENVMINTIATVALFASYGLVITAVSFHNWGKIVLLFLSVLFATVSTIGPLYKVTIGFLKNKEEYLVKWKRGLRDEKLPTGLNYSVGDTTSSGNGHGSIVMSSYRSSTQKSYI
ncbi:hypothetical protein HDV06_001376 [Boothiomyces sp. JEL0866]|nr:hypothetical protein HDV06_001376 [Boothiomyces sp. JEL0866]